MKAKIHNFILLSLLSSIFISCDKGYTIRFTNYAQQPIDSVIIGNKDIVFTNIEIQALTEYKNIKKGKYAIECVTKSKNRYYSSVFIPSKGNGKRSIQIDGTNTIVILEQ